MVRQRRGWGDLSGAAARTGVVSLVAVFGCGGGSSAEDTGSGSTSQVGDDSVGSDTTTATTGTTTGGETTGDSSTTAAGSSSGDETGLPGDIKRIELRAGGFTPPAAETWYSCFSFPVTFSALHHIVGFEPVVDGPTIHHYVLSLASGTVNRDPNQPCFEWPGQILWAWAPGIETQMLPDEAGFLVGDAAGGQHTLILQVHYNDPLGQGTVDDSGIDVLVTQNLRPNSAGIFSQGDVGGIVIPPGQSDHAHVSTCGSNQTASLLDQSIHVFSSFLHAHEIGKFIRTDVYRDGALAGTIAVDDPFDFNDQKFVDAAFDIEPGDVLETTCIYDSSDRTGVTLGGVASDEEMCIDFMMYYPKVTGEKCGTL